MPISNAEHDYAERHSSPLGPLLHELQRATYLRTLHPQMLSGALQGQFLRLLSQMLRPRRVLEIGTFTGFSALCLAEGIPEGGVLHSIERDDELAPIIRDFWERAALPIAMRLHLGPAAAILPSLAGPWDLVFIDADKENYALYYDLVLPQMPLGAVLLADNVLWHGKVLSDQKDKKSAAIHAFNEKILADPRVENVLLPLRDGMMLLRKIAD